MVGKLFDIEELAYFLKTPIKQVYNLAARGQIPGYKVGRNWRFDLLEVKQKCKAKLRK